MPADFPARILQPFQPQPAYNQFLNIMGKQNYDRSLSARDRNGMAVLYGAPSPLPGVHDKKVT